ncbi:MAG: class I SAM-dependent methyltransferase, partial [Methanobacteriota archaeon]
SPPPQWGDVATVRQRLGSSVRDLAFDRETLSAPAMSPGHYREMMERTAGPVLKLVQALQRDPAKLAEFRRETEALIGTYFEPERNLVRQDYLMTRAVKA